MMNTSEEFSSITRAKETRNTAKHGTLSKYKIKKTGLIIFAVLAAGIIELVVVLLLENN